jgi:multidrug resistance efflux pump
MRLNPSAFVVAAVILLAGSAWAHHNMSALFDFNDRVTVSGTLAAEEQVTVSFKVTGRVEELRVDLGSAVHKGDVIARLTPTDFDLRLRQADAALQQARARLGLDPDGETDTVDIEQTGLVRQARAAMNEARRQRERVATFVDRGISAKADLEAADAALEIAEGKHQDALEEVRNRQAVLAQRRSEVALARQQLDDTVLRSPITRLEPSGQRISTRAPAPVTS